MPDFLDLLWDALTVFADVLQVVSAPIVLLLAAIKAYRWLRKPRKVQGDIHHDPTGE